MNCQSSSAEIEDSTVMNKPKVSFNQCECENEFYFSNNMDEDYVTSKERCKYVSYWKAEGHTSTESVKGRLKDKM